MSLPLYIALTVFNLGLFIFANIYIPKRLCTLFGIRKAKYYILAFTAFTVLGAVGIMTASKVTHVLLLTLFKLSIVWLGLIMFLFSLLIIFEIIRPFLKINMKYAGISIIGLSIITSFYGIWNARDYRVNHIDIPLKGLKQEVKIFHVPDIHLGPFRGKTTLENIVEDIARLNPDFVLVNGDLVDGLDGLNADILGLFKHIKTPVYFTDGNHDGYVDIKRLEEVLTQNGVIILNNEVIHRNGIQLVGLKYMNADDKVYDAHASSRTETIQSVLQTLKVDPGIPSVFVHHSPVGIEYMNKAGAGLVLSGHTHAGQLFPATLIGQLQFQYLKGLYTFNNTFIHVSQGIGTFGPPMRIGTKGEAVLVKLVRPKNK